ncbi:nucleotidyltransferase family protein [Marinobacter bohaiensis]|uniref:nucleotidyltransferase family protein n=1 Tax=Marinobacter bohaiensis TaxID=2201898 RepID=UPI000DAB83DD|nr:nucleotidyltransferase family protein [Marinobacter bohaiensis]
MTNKLDVSAAALVLAAGGSRRMGRPKAALSWCGNSLLALAIRRARELSDRVHVVVGGHYPLIRFRCAAQPDRWVVNPDWADGQAGSLQRGLSSLPVGITGAYVLLVDQPAIHPEFWPSLRQAVDEEEGRRPVAADLGGMAGAPAYLPRSMWPAIARLHGDQGAGRLLRRLDARLVAAPGAQQDIDRWADWQRLRALRKATPCPPR